MPLSLYSKVQEQLEAVEALKKLWMMLLEGAPMPPNEQFGRWHNMHNSKTLIAALQITARKFQKTPAMTLEHLVRYCSSVANQRKYKQSTTQEMSHDKATA